VSFVACVCWHVSCDLMSLTCAALPAESKLGKDYMGERVVFDDDEEEEEEEEEAGGSSKKSKKDGKCKHASKAPTEKESSREKKSKHSKKSAGKSSKESEKGDGVQKKSKSSKTNALDNSGDTASVSSKERTDACASGEKAALKKGGKKTSHSDDVAINTAAESRQRGSSDKAKSKDGHDQCGAAAVRRSPRLSSSPCPSAALRLGLGAF
jgi:hypothetical protein